MAIPKKSVANTSGEPDPSRDIVVSIGLQTDGVTYRLHPKSAERVRAEFHGVEPAPSVYVGYATKEDFETLHGPLWRQVVALLTGVDFSRLKGAGRVILWNSSTGKMTEVS